MDVYAVTATIMRAERLFALVMALGIIVCWWASFVRLFRPHAATVPAIAGDVAQERERNRAMFVAIAGAIFLFQVGFLAPLPGIAVMRVWMAGLTIVIACLLWAIYHHGAQDARFRPRRTAAAHICLFVVCAIFAVLTR